MSAICIIPTLSLYGLATLMAWLEGALKRPTVRVWAYRSFLAGLTFHTVYIPFAIFWGGAPYFANRGVTLGLLAWTCALAYAVLARNVRWQYLGIIFLPLIFVLSLQALLGAAPFTFVKYGSEGWILPVHLSVAMIAVAIFLMSFVAGSVWLYEERRLKSRRPAPRLLNLPPLPTLEKVLSRLLIAGFGVLTVTITTGIILGIEHFGAMPTSAHRWWSIAAWVLYGLVLQLRLMRGDRGRKWVLLSLLGFVVITLSFLEVHGL